LKKISELSIVNEFPQNNMLLSHTSRKSHDLKKSRIIDENLFKINDFYLIILNPIVFEITDYSQ